MTAIQFLADWTLRSSILILSGAFLLWALRVKDSSIRLAGCIAMLGGSLAIPVLTAVLPAVPFTVTRHVGVPVAAAPEVHDVKQTAAPISRSQAGPVVKRFDWVRVVLTIYGLIAIFLLVRLCVGLVMSLRLLSASRATERATEGVAVRESARVAAPVTLGIIHPAIVLPADWREWHGAKLEAVLAHERSHIGRRDPAVQLLSSIHRALLWHSPLSWFLHNRIVRVAEEASDDAALAVNCDRAFYAEMLLEFMQRGVRGASRLGVPMARYGRADSRIHRILDGSLISRGVTRRGVVAILALGSPLAYVVGAARPQSATPPASTSMSSARQAAPVPPAVGAPPVVAPSRVELPRAPARAGYLAALGSVAGLLTVTVRSRIDGQLLSVNFKEGELVHEGQLLASIDPRPFEIQLAQATGQMDQDLAQLTAAMKVEGVAPDSQAAAIGQLKAKIETDRANINAAKLQLIYAQITAPISGVAGLRLIDPGNIVRPSDATGIVTLNQLQPIAVVFAIPEDRVGPIRARLENEEKLVVEAWDRANRVRLASGRLVAVDNQIDVETGTAKLKSIFDNRDGALFPNQFVNVRLME